jgi:DNA-binding NarL/FixJ family response regulator
MHKSFSFSKRIMHKNTTEKSTREAKNDTKITVLDIEKENRLAKVISLFSKGLSQEEIAFELHIDQSIVRRDLQFRVLF